MDDSKAVERKRNHQAHNKQYCAPTVDRREEHELADEPHDTAQNANAITNYFHVAGVGWRHRAERSCQATNLKLPSI